jgi:hypothetical protein
MLDMKTLLCFVALLATLSCGGGGSNTTAEIEANYGRYDTCLKKSGGTQTSVSFSSIRATCSEDDIRKINEFYKCNADGCEKSPAAYTCVALAISDACKLTS